MAWRFYEAPCTVAGLTGACSWHSAGMERSWFPVPPDGCSDIVWREIQPGAWHARLLPPTTQGFLHPVKPGERLYGVRLLPGQVQALFSMKPGTIRPGGVDLGVGFRLQAPKPSRREDAGLALTDRIMRALMTGMGPREVAEGFGLHSRTLRRRVQDAAGCPPKELQRMWRLRRAMFVAVARARPDWSDVAVGAGFTDQSHLIRDCRNLMGETPVDIHHLMRQGHLSVSYNTCEAQPG